MSLHACKLRAPKMLQRPMNLKMQSGKEREIQYEAAIHMKYEFFGHSGLRVPTIILPLSWLPINVLLFCFSLCNYQLCVPSILWNFRHCEKWCMPLFWIDAGGFMDR